MENRRVLAEDADGDVAIKMLLKFVALGVMPVIFGGMFSLMSSATFMEGWTMAQIGAYLLYKLAALFIK